MVEKDRGERIGDVRRLENEEKTRITAALFDELHVLLQQQEVAVMLKEGTVEQYFEEGTKLTKPVLDDVDFSDVDLKTLRAFAKLQTTETID